jgi:hypothetical protein
MNLCPKSTKNSVYSPKCVEYEFSEVRMQHRAYPHPGTPEITLSHAPLRPVPVELVTRMDRYACLRMRFCRKQMFAVTENQLLRFPRPDALRRSGRV